MNEDLTKALDNWIINKIEDAEKSYSLNMNLVKGAEVYILKITSNFKVAHSEFITITFEKVFPPSDTIRNGQKWGSDEVSIQKETKKIDLFFEETKKKANEIWS